MYLSFAPLSCRVQPAPLNLPWKGRQRHLAQVPFTTLLPLCVGMSALSFPLLTSLAFSGHVFLIFSFSGYFCFAFFLGSSSSSHSGRSKSCPSSVLPQGFPLDGLTCPAASDTPLVQKPPRPCPSLALTSHLKHSARTSLLDSLPAPHIQHVTNPLPFQTIPVGEVAVPSHPLRPHECEGPYPRCPTAPAVQPALLAVSSNSQCSYPSQTVAQDSVSPIRRQSDLSPRCSVLRSDILNP